MKKILAFILCLALALTSAVAMMITAFADADPIVWDYTKSEPTGLVPGPPTHNWGAMVTGETTYDANEKAIRINDGKKLTTGDQAYALINDNDQPLVDWYVYKYMAICYKTVAINETTGFYIMTDGGSGFVTLPASPDSYTKLVVNTNEGDGLGSHIGMSEAQFGGVSMCLSWWCPDEKIAEGGTGYFIKYIAFFETEAEAKAFDIEAFEPEASEPEASEPEASEPEASEPEVSEPEVSEVENSQAGGNEGNKPNTNTRDVAIISGAILLCAAAGVVAVISKKSKR